MILEAINKTGTHIDAFIINHSTAIERPFASTIMRDLENTRIYIIDTSKLSNSRKLKQYPYDEFSFDKIYNFIQSFVDYKKDDMELVLDL